MAVAGGQQLYVVLLLIDEVLLGLNLGMELLGLRVLLHHDLNRFEVIGGCSSVL